MEINRLLTKFYNKPINNDFSEFAMPLSCDTDCFVDEEGTRISELTEQFIVNIEHAKGRIVWDCTCYPRIRPLPREQVYALMHPTAEVQMVYLFHYIEKLIHVLNYDGIQYPSAKDRQRLQKYVGIAQELSLQLREMMHRISLATRSNSVDAALTVWALVREWMCEEENRRWDCMMWGWPVWLNSRHVKVARTGMSPGRVVRDLEFQPDTVGHETEGERLARRERLRLKTHSNKWFKHSMDLEFGEPAVIYDAFYHLRGPGYWRRLMKWLYSTGMVSDVRYVWHIFYHHPSNSNVWAPGDEEHDSDLKTEATWSVKIEIIMFDEYIRAMRRWKVDYTQVFLGSVSVSGVGSDFRVAEGRALSKFFCYLVKGAKFSCSNELQMNPYLWPDLDEKLDVLPLRVLSAMRLFSLGIFNIESDVMEEVERLLELSE